MLPLLKSGLLWVLESPWIFFQIFKAWKVLENRHGSWKSLNLCLKVPESLLLKCHVRSALLLVEGFWGREICLECVVSWGCTPDPAEGAHDAPPDPLVGWGGHPSPRTSTPRRLDSRAFAYISFVWSLKVLEFDFDKWARTLSNALPYKILMSEN